MKKIFAVAAAASVAVTASPVSSSVVIVGKSAARSCYEVARDLRNDLAALELCNEAFENGLGTAERAATFVNRGVIHTLRKNHEAALRDFNAAIAVDPAQPEAALNKAILMLGQEGQDAAVVQLVDKALAHDTTKPALAYFTRGIANEGLGRVAAAYSDYKRAAALEPKWSLPAP
jgi:tetratricopeptide (TPR) repeat protein